MEEKQNKKQKKKIAAEYRTEDALWLRAGTDVLVSETADIYMKGKFKNKLSCTVKFLS